MPYPRAHYFVLLLLPASIAGFTTYLSDPAGANVAKHVHAVGATLWILLLAAQNASIHQRRRSLHRTVGIASLALLPVFLAGLFMVFQSEARRIAAGDPWSATFGPGIGAITLLAIGATAWMFYSGLRHRHNVQLHARWMIVTLFPFAESVLGRIMNNYVPGLLVRDIDDIRRIYDAFHIAQVLAISLAIALYLGNRKHGTPFLFVCAVLVLQSIALETLDGFEPWRTVFVDTASWPTAIMIAAGLLLGSVAASLGWIRGRRR